MKITIEEMEEAIRKLEREGYSNVHIVGCRYWKGNKFNGGGKSRCRRNG